MTTEYEVTLAVQSSADGFLKVIEVLSRTMTGLVLDGYAAGIAANREPEEAVGEETELTPES